MFGVKINDALSVLSQRACLMEFEGVVWSARCSTAGVENTALFARE